MFNIIFYEDKNGKCELQMYLIELKRKADNGNKYGNSDRWKIGYYMHITRMTHLFYYIILKRKQEKHLREN